MSPADVSASRGEGAFGSSALSPHFHGSECFQGVSQRNPRHVGQQVFVHDNKHFSSCSCKCKEQCEQSAPCVGSWLPQGEIDPEASRLAAAQRLFSAVFTAEAASDTDVSRPRRSLPENLIPHAASFLLATVRSAATAASRIVQTLATSQSEEVSLTSTLGSLSASAFNAEASSEQWKLPWKLTKGENYISELQAESAGVCSAQRDSSAAKIRCLAALSNAEELRRWEVAVYRGLMELFFCDTQVQEASSPSRPSLTAWPPTSKVEGAVSSSLASTYPEKAAPASSSRQTSAPRLHASLLPSETGSESRNKPLNPHAPPFIPRSSTQKEHSGVYNSPWNTLNVPRDEDDGSVWMPMSEQSSQISSSSSFANATERGFSDAQSFAPSVHPRNEASQRVVCSSDRRLPPSFNFDSRQNFAWREACKAPSTHTPLSLAQLKQALQILQSLQQQQQLQPREEAPLRGGQEVSLCSLKENGEHSSRDQSLEVVSQSPCAVGRCLPHEDESVLLPSSSLQQLPRTPRSFDPPDSLKFKRKTRSASEVPFLKRCGRRLSRGLSKQCVSSRSAGNSRVRVKAKETSQMRLRDVRRDGSLKAGRRLPSAPPSTLVIAAQRRNRTSFVPERRRGLSASSGPSICRKAKCQRESGSSELSTRWGSFCSFCSFSLSGSFCVGGCPSSGCKCSEAAPLSSSSFCLTSQLSSERIGADAEEEAGLEEDGTEEGVAQMTATTIPSATTPNEDASCPTRPRRMYSAIDLLRVQHCFQAATLSAGNSESEFVGEYSLCPSGTCSFEKNFALQLRGMPGAAEAGPEIRPCDSTTRLSSSSSSLAEPLLPLPPSLPPLLPNPPMLSVSKNRVAGHSRRRRTPLFNSQSASSFGGVSDELTLQDCAETFKGTALQKGVASPSQTSIPQSSLRSSVFPQTRTHIDLNSERGFFLSEQVFALHQLKRQPGVGKRRRGRRLNAEFSKLHSAVPSASLQRQETVSALLKPPSVKPPEVPGSARLACWTQPNAAQSPSQIKLPLSLNSDRYEPAPQVVSSQSPMHHLGTQMSSMPERRNLGDAEGRRRSEKADPLHEDQIAARCTYSPALPLWLASSNSSSPPTQRSVECQRLQLRNPAPTDRTWEESAEALNASSNLGSNTACSSVSCADSRKLVVSPLAQREESSFYKNSAHSPGLLDAALSLLKNLTKHASKKNPSDVEVRARPDLNPQLLLQLLSKMQTRQRPANEAL